MKMRLEERFNLFESNLGALLALDEFQKDEDLVDYIKLQIRMQKEEVDRENINLELFLYFDKYCRAMELKDLDIKIDFKNCNSGTFIDTLLERIIISFLFKRFSEKIQLIKDGQQSQTN